jgi:hypothetical protein
MIRKRAIGFRAILSMLVRGQNSCNEDCGLNFPLPQYESKIPRRVYHSHGYNQQSEEFRGP